MNGELLRELREAYSTLLLTGAPIRAGQLAEAAERIDQLEAELAGYRNEVARLHYFLGVIDEAADGIRSETAIASRPQHLKDGAS